MKKKRKPRGFCSHRGGEKSAGVVPSWIFVNCCSQEAGESNIFDCAVDLVDEGFAFLGGQEGFLFALDIADSNQFFNDRSAGGRGSQAALFHVGGEVFVFYPGQSLSLVMLLEKADISARRASLSHLGRGKLVRSFSLWRKVQ